jgi:putative FmdB family regulatory protein
MISILLFPLDNLVRNMNYILKIRILLAGCGHTYELPLHMPTYVYRATDSGKGCDHCQSGFEVIQRMMEPALTQCPRCKNLISRVLFAPTVVIKGGPLTETDRKIKEYEKEGKWSHAAELADKEAEKTKREDLKTRALDDYKKAGYHFDKYDT